MNEFTCTSCRGTFTKADPDHGSDGLCAQCKIAFGLVSLHDTAERNHIERLRSLEVVRRYGETFSAVLDQILTQPKPITYKGHRLCPWCASPGVPMESQVKLVRIVCASPDCPAAPEILWMHTEAEAWKLWDTRK